MASADVDVDPRAPEARANDVAMLADVMGVVLRVGLVMVRSGAAAFRSRLTMARVARSLGVNECEFVVTPDLVQVSLSSGGATLARVIHIGESGVNMGRLAAVERLSRELAAEPGRANTFTVEARLGAIEAAPPTYSRWLTVVMLGAACSAFCGAMGAGTLQMAGAYAGASLGHVLRLRLIAKHVHIVSLVTLCTFTSSVVAFGVVWWGAHLGNPAPVAFEIASGKAVLASVLYLVPGVPLVTSLLDIIHFDLVAGLARAAFASLIVACMGVGMLIFLSVIRHAFP
jgi:uncharacterized membrane protein YjjP (DUF1212 family)